jgi:arsenite methyltransferase
MTESTNQHHEQLREAVRQRYAAAATKVTQEQAWAESGLPVLNTSACCGSDSSCGGGTDTRSVITSDLYASDEVGDLPSAAVLASLGCGNPTALAELKPGETVLDLGSGGGIDVLLSARRVGRTGFAYGVDMTDEMLDLARANAAKAGAANVEFRKGTIEELPLADGSVDVVISNCVVNLSTDKAAVLAETFRVLAPGGRIGISDVVAEDDVTPAQRAERGSYVGCIAGALSRAEYLDCLAAAGFTGASVEFTHEVAPGLHGAIVRATKPAAAEAACCYPGSPCCGPDC